MFFIFLFFFFLWFCQVVGSSSFPSFFFLNFYFYYFFKKTLLDDFLCYFLKCPLSSMQNFFLKYNVLPFVLFKRDMMVNLYKPYFQKNQKVFHPSTFPPLNQTQMRKTKNFSIFPLFHPLSIFHPLTFSFSQSNGP